MQNILKNYYNHIYQMIRANTYIYRIYVFIYKSLTKIDVFLLNFPIFNNL